MALAFQRKLIIEILCSSERPIAHLEEPLHPMPLRFNTSYTYTYNMYTYTYIYI